MKNRYSVSYDAYTYPDKQNTSTKIQINKLQTKKPHTIVVITLRTSCQVY